MCLEIDHRHAEHGFLIVWDSEMTKQKKLQEAVTGFLVGSLFAIQWLIYFFSITELNNVKSLRGPHALRGWF